MTNVIPSILVYTYTTITLIAFYLIGKFIRGKESIEGLDDSEGDAGLYDAQRKARLGWGAALLLLLLLFDCFFWIEFGIEDFNFIYSMIIDTYTASTLIWIIMVVMQFIVFFFGLRRTKDLGASHDENQNEEGESKKNVTSNPILDLFGMIILTCLLESIVMYFTFEQTPGLILIIIGILKIKDIIAGEGVWVGAFIAGIVLLILVSALDITIGTSSMLSLSTLGAISGLGLVNKQKTLTAKRMNKSLIQHKSGKNIYKPELTRKVRNQNISTKKVNLSIKKIV